MEIPFSFILLFGISGGEIFIVLLLVLLLFGPKKIPEIARTIGKGINEVKKVQRDINAEINRYADEIEKPAKMIQSDIDGFNDKLGEIENITAQETSNDTDTAVDLEEEDLPHPYKSSYEEYIEREKEEGSENVSS
jgi:sec-independent protein translocase protein TatA